MNVLVAMCKGFDKEDIAKAMTESRFKPTSIIIGGVKACENWVAHYANDSDLPIRTMTSSHSSAQHRMVRNMEQIHTADALLAFWEGTPNVVQDHLISTAKEKGIPIYIYSHDEENEDD